MTLLTDVDFLKKIIHNHWQKYGPFEVTDLYKLLHQSTFGPGYHKFDRDGWIAQLKEEWETLDKMHKGEPLLEMIDPNGEVMRVNLRVYWKTGGNLSDLADVCLKSAEDYQSDKDRLNRFWNVVLEMAKEGEILFHPDHLEDYFIEMRRKEFPPVQHSESYLEANNPAYRIVVKSNWEVMQAEKIG